MGLASVYRKYSLQGEGGREASKQISWIKDKLLHIYYQNSIDDRFEKIFTPLFLCHSLPQHSPTLLCHKASVFFKQPNSNTVLPLRAGNGSDLLSVACVCVCVAQRAFRC